jgi:flagellar biosynthetic protein FlhB
LPREFAQQTRRAEIQTTFTGGPAVAAPIIDLQWFAAEDEGRTEEASAEQLRKAREEGRVAKSQDLTSALVLVVAVVMLIVLAPYLLRNCAAVMRYFFSRATTFGVQDRGTGEGAFNYLLRMLVPFFVAVPLIGVAGNMIQTRGFLFSTKPLAPKFENVLPRLGTYMRKTIFSAEGAFHVAMAIVKIGAVLLIAVLLIRADIPWLLSMHTVDLWTAITHIAWTAAKLLAIAAVLFVALSVLDYMLQRYLFMEKLKMTRQQVVEEYKMLEGDPQVKQQIMQQYQAMLRANVRKNVAEADVVITNPTHYAVAIKYEVHTMRNPEVTAKGEDDRALLIRRIAAENNVPIVENRPLARGLYESVEEGETIPERFYQALINVFTSLPGFAERWGG